MAHASSVLCGVLVMIAVQPAPANSSKYCRCSGSDASSGWLVNVAVSGRVHFRVEIAQLHVDPKGRKAAAERAIAASSESDRTANHALPSHQSNADFFNDIGGKRTCNTAALTAD
jgi:hypothetical protein